MRRISIACMCLVLATTSVTMISCSGSSGKDDKLTSQQLKTPEHFKLIPADSPYVMADIQPFPYDKLGQDFFASYAPMISQAREQIMRDYQDVPAEMLNQETRLMIAILDELDGNFSVDGMKNLGIDLKGHISVYGLGIWPVVRISLNDSKKLEAMIARVEAKVGQALPKVTVEGVEFREVRDGEAALPIIIEKDALIVGFTSTKFYDQYIKLALGKTKPAKSYYEENRIAAMQARHGFKPYISGIFDVQGLVNALLGTAPASLTAKSLVGLPLDTASLSADCLAEYAELTKHAPQLHFGYRDVTAQTISAALITTPSTDLPARLSEIKGVIPAHGSEVYKNALAWFGGGVNVKKLASFLTTQADRINKAPYKCENLVDLNQMAAGFTQAATGIPNFAQAIEGSSLVVSKVDVDIQNRKIGTLDVALMIRTSDPQGLFQVVKSQMPFPELQSVNPAADGVPVPVQLPENITMMVPDLPTPYVIMTKDGLALALGNQMSERVSAALKAAPAKGSPMFAISYDMQGIAKLIEKNVPMGMMGATERATYETMLNAYSAFGPAYFSMDVNPKTYVMETKMTLLPKAGK